MTTYRAGVRSLRGALVKLRTRCNSAARCQYKKLKAETAAIAARFSAFSFQLSAFPPVAPPVRGVRLGAGRGFFTPAGGVRLSDALPTPSSSADRAPAFEAGGRRCEPCLGGHARVAQPEERRHDTPEAAGAEPAGGTTSARGEIAAAPARGAGARKGVRVQLPPSRPPLRHAASDRDKEGRWHPG